MVTLESASCEGAKSLDCSSGSGIINAELGERSQEPTVINLTCVESAEPNFSHRPMTTLLLDALTVSVAWAHVFLSPYTKVEESFNLHATHDVIMYGLRPETLLRVRRFTPC
jgi:hypothetical protein